jgi:hypothetical protein
MSDWKNILDKAKEETNKELMIEIKGMSVLTADEIESIASSDVDKTKLRDLLLIIRDTTKSNENKNKIIKELVDGSDVVINLINKIL